VLGALLGAAERSASPVCVELDHAHELDSVRAACALGVGAVMADGSHLPRAANAECVNAAREIAAPLGIAVEAELGAVRGDEEVAVPADAGELTDPAEAAAFVRETGADCLAVAVGNVHGIYRGAPRLDIGLVCDIAERTGVPLALHGGSGLPAAAVRGAVAAGMAKVNINTELRQAYLEATARELDAALVGARLLDLHGAQMAAAEALAERKLAMLETEVLRPA
jgi:ketose-bisphosphate aldolase